VFLPMYYTIISLMVPLSLWAAWGIYSEPIRYRTLFPHNEARKQAIAVLLLTVLFFLPFFQLWVNDKVLLFIGGVYAFLFVPVTVGFVKPNILEQQNIIIKLKRKYRSLKTHLIENLKQFMRTFCLFLICVKELFITLPYFYRSFITFQVLTNQIIFFILAEKVICPQENFISLYLLLLYTSLMYVRKYFERNHQLLISNQSQLSEILNAFSNSTFANAVTRIIITSLVISIFIQKCYKIEPQVVFVLLCSSYFACTEPFLAAEDFFTSMVSFFQSDIFEQLEHLYIPLFIRLLCILSSLLLCAIEISQFPLMVTLACYTNLYVPFTRLSSEILTPLELELKSLQVFRQATQEELTKSGFTCPICLDTMHVARITPCGHVFHSYCLRQCLTRSNTCPCCRTQIL